MLKEQILDTTELIDKEVEQFKRRKEQRLRELGVTVGEPEPSEDTNNRAPDKSRPQSSSTKSARPTSSHEKTHEKANHDKDHDDPGYVMVEAEEDTVIY